MANTYSKIYLHFVFSPKNRQALISKEMKPELEKYISTIVQNHKHKMLAIACMPDHIHFFINYDVNQLIPKLVEEVKTSTNLWIQAKKLCPYKFDWQKGYGVFSNSESQIDGVIKYIMNQEQHHKKKKFREEYLDLLA
jgi:putative transposase